jgi:pyrophosphatase PpaX
MLKAILFDLDGTLVNVRKKYRLSSVKKVLRKLKARIPKEKEIEAFWFEFDRDKIISKWNVKPNDFWFYFNQQNNVRKRKKNSFVYKEVKNALKKLKAKNLKIGIVTNGTPKVAEIGIELIGINLIDAIVIAHAWLKRKGKPETEAINECLALLGEKPRNALFVGNGEEDIIAAKKTGMKAVLIEREYPVNIKIKRKADFKIKNLNELIKVIEKI